MDYNTDYIEQITSLCITVNTNYGEPRLYRIADINEYDKLIPFIMDDNNTHEGLNNDLIFHPRNSIGEEALIAFWDLKLSNDKKIWSYKNKEIKWIECVQLNDVSNIDELQTALYNGIDFEFEPDHNYLIEYSKEKSNIIKCVYCTSSEFNFRNNKYILRNDIYHMNSFEILESDIAIINISYIPKFTKKYYINLCLPNKTEKILIRSPADTVKNAILARIKKCTVDFNKNDRRIISSFIKTLKSDSIIDQVILETNCTKDEAVEYIEIFLKDCEKYFIEEDFIDSTMLRLIEYNSDIGLKFQIEIEDEWRIQNNSRISELETEIQNKESELTNIKKQFDFLIIAREDLESRINKLKSDYDEQISLANSIAQQVRNKISFAKEDVAKFFADYSMYSNSPVINNELSDTKLDIIQGILVNEDPDTIENLEVVGVNKKYTSSLAAYLLAAYFYKVPLTLAGYGALDIMNALSSSVFNKTTDRIIIDNNLINKLPDNSIIAIHNGFGYMDIINNLETDSYICFVAQTSEEMILEPRSFFNYSLPLFTEYFITEKPNGELFGAINNVEYVGNMKNQATKLPEYIVPDLAFNNIKKLLGIINDIYSDIFEYEKYLLFIVPVMLTANKRDDLLDLISSSTLSDKDKADLLRKIGER